MSEPVKQKWWEELEGRHWLALLAFVFLVLSPFLALARVEAGVLSFGVALMLLLMLQKN